MLGGCSNTNSVSRSLAPFDTATQGYSRIVRVGDDTSSCGVVECKRASRALLVIQLSDGLLKYVSAATDENHEMGCWLQLTSQPPVPPQWSGFGAQSTSCCGDKVRSFPNLMAKWLSMDSVALNALQAHKVQDRRNELLERLDEKQTMDTTITLQVRTSKNRRPLGF